MAFPRWLAKTIFIVLTIAVWLPTLAVLATVATVAATGCQVDEATSHPCMVAGQDIGEVLYGGLVMVFLAGPTLPFALGAVIIWYMQRRRTARQSRKTVF